MNPLDRSSLIAQAEVLYSAWSSWESEYTETISQSDDDRSRCFGKAAAVTKRRVGAADGEA